MRRKSERGGRKRVKWWETRQIEESVKGSRCRRVRRVMRERLALTSDCGSFVKGLIESRWRLFTGRRQTAADERGVVSGSHNLCRFSPASPVSSRNPKNVHVSFSYHLT